METQNPTPNYYNRLRKMIREAIIKGEILEDELKEPEKGKEKPLPKKKKK